MNIEKKVELTLNLIPEILHKLNEPSLAHAIQQSIAISNLIVTTLLKQNKILVTQNKECLFNSCINKNILCHICTNGILVENFYKPQSQN